MGLQGVTEVLAVRLVVRELHHNRRCQGNMGMWEGHVEHGPYSIHITGSH